MRLVTDRERALIARVGPVLLRRFEELVDDWAASWSAAAPGRPPADLPALTRVAVEQGVDAAHDAQERHARGLAHSGTPLDEIVLAVLLWEEAVLRRLARDAEEDIFSGAAALNRFHHGLVVSCAEAYGAIISVGRDEVRRGLEDADRLKTELVSMVSHDLKTPLTTIQACTDQLLSAEDMSPEQRRRFVSMIGQNAERLSRLISSILEVSRLEARAVDLSLGPLALGTLVRRLLEGTVPDAPVRVEPDDGVPEVVADRDAVERIVLNLVDNALRFSPDGDAVTVRIVPAGPFVELRVADRGEGIPEDRRNALFSKFFRVDPSVGRRSGAGLGLAIVRGLAEAMGGSAGYRPNEPNGSVFWVRLPAVVPDAAGSA